MKYADWKYLALICTFLGVLLLTGGVVTYAYGERVSPEYIFTETGEIIAGPWGYGTRYPYRDYAIPLIIFGVVLLVIGVARFGRAKRKGK